MGKSKGAAAEAPFPHTGVLGVTRSPFDLPVPEVHSRDWRLGPVICNVLVPCVLQKFKEYVNGSNLITKLQAKHDLLKQTLGEGESGGGGLCGGAVFPTGFCCGPLSYFSLRHRAIGRMRPGSGATS